MYADELIDEIYVIIGNMGYRDEHTTWQHSAWLDKSKAVFFAEQMQKDCERVISEVRRAGKDGEMYDLSDTVLNYMSKKWKERNFPSWCNLCNDLPEYTVVTLKMFDNIATDILFGGGDNG